jgi:hypothetical protein
VQQTREARQAHAYMPPQTGERRLVPADGRIRQPHLLALTSVVSVRPDRNSAAVMPRAYAAEPSHRLRDACARTVVGGFTLGKPTSAVDADRDRFDVLALDRERRTVVAPPEYEDIASRVLLFGFCRHLNPQSDRAAACQQRRTGSFRGTLEF